MMKSREKTPAAASNQLGTFGGVFTPSILTILGVIMFMRAGFVIGQAGIFHMLLILLLAKSITSLSAISISAVSTNTPVAGGGAYFLISRSLGPEFGGAIGLALFIAQAISVPFYILGFTEAVVRTFSGLADHFQTVALITALFLFTVSYIGAKWAVKTQYIIMSILFLSIVVFMGGALLHFQHQVFIDNWTSHYSGPSMSFWKVFAIYFPAVTGIMAGVNMSGDLKDPGRSIPRGTLAAVAVGLLVYGMQIVICGGAQTRPQLVENSFETLRCQSLFGAGFLVVAGVFAATLSSGLGSFLGAPRVLQAVARDKIVPSLKLFAKGARKGDEPHRALILTLLMTVGIIVWAGPDTQGGAFNILAAVVTMFFLYTYGMVNLAAFIESFAGNPSFRPRFKYYHWFASLAGTIGCAVTAFLIDFWAAVAAAVILAVIYGLLRRRVLRARFGDARWGFVYSRLRDNILKLSKMSTTSKNWRPTLMVMLGNPDRRYTMAMYALWFGQERGVVTLARVLVGNLDELANQRKTAIDQLNSFLQEHKFKALSTVVVSQSIDEGLNVLLQGHPISPLRPNIVILGWSENPERAEAFVSHLKSAQVLGMSLILLSDKGLPAGGTPKRRVDIWWRGRENGSLMAILAHLLKLNWNWSDATIRLLRLIEDEAGRQPSDQALRDLVQAARLDAEVQIIVSKESFCDVLHRHSSDAAVVFLGFTVPQSEHVYDLQKQFNQILEGLPTTLLVCSSGQADLLA